MTMVPPERNVWCIARTFSAAILIVGLVGCLVPEKFEAAVDVRPDGSFVYKYTGTAVHALVMAQLAKTGELTDKDEAKLKTDADKATRSGNGFKKLDYLGRGKYDVQIEEERKLGQQIGSLKILSVTKEKDGAVVIAGQVLKPKEKSDLAALGVKIDGSLQVRLPANAKVLETNATGTPGLLSKAYSWKIGGVDQRPSIKFVLN
ncbi:hypothetical protein [Variovorax sp. ZT4R33]|uniref:hypothetical protein n=1 Tax=Variovorax sp. ZT4R33 TaxID=3443743 RepID=UPI003F478ADF